MTQHTFECDDASLDPRIKHDLPLFYASADTPDHERWISFLTNDAVLKKGGSQLEGKDAIMDFRNKVKKEVVESPDETEHIVHKVFPSGAGSLEIMLHGRTVRRSPDGREDGADWAARIHYKEVNGDLKIKLYHIYMERTLAKQ